MIYNLHVVALLITYVHSIGLSIFPVRVVFGNFWWRSLGGVAVPLLGQFSWGQVILPPG